VLIDEAKEEEEEEEEGDPLFALFGIAGVALFALFGIAGAGPGPEPGESVVRGEAALSGDGEDDGEGNGEGDEEGEGEGDPYGFGAPLFALFGIAPTPADVGGSVRSEVGLNMLYEYRMRKLVYILDFS
jgi:hypothetical protein